MKKLLILCTFTLTFFFSGAVGFSDILKDLDKFQQSLGDWVTQIDELNARISNLESDKASREKQTAELNQSLANIENLLSDMDAKVLTLKWCYRMVLMLPRFVSDVLL